MKRLFIVLLITINTACSSGGGGSTDPGSPNPPGGSNISGIVSTPSGMLASLKPYSLLANISNFLIPVATADITGISPVAGVTVELIQVDNNGIQIGDPLATAMTDANGMFVLETEESPSLFLQISVGTGDAKMRAFVTSETTDINPMTEYVVDKISTKINSDAQVNLSMFTLTEIQGILDMIANQNIDLTAFSTVNEAKNQFETLVGSDVDAAIATAVIDLTGEWTLRVITLESNCGDPLNIVYEVDALNIEQIGNNVTFQYGPGETTSAVLSGYEFTDVTLSTYPDGAGTTTETGLALTLNTQANEIIGDLDWNWSSPEIPMCNGKSQLIFKSAETPTALEGSWQTSCYPLNIGTPASGLFTETYQGSHYSYIVQGFDNDICDGTPIVTKSGNGYIFIGQDVPANANSITATELEVTIDSTSIEGQTGQIADNMGGFVAGDQYFDIFYISGNQSYYGDYSTGDATSPTTRPTDIDLSYPLTQQ